MIIHVVPTPPDAMDWILFVAAAVEITVIVIVVAHNIATLFARGDRR